MTDVEVFPTGLRGVDEDLRLGGLPAGSLVGFEYPPESAGEAVLWTFVGRGLHPDVHLPVAPDEAGFVRADRIVYVTTGKAPDRIASALRAHVPDPTADRLGLPIDFVRVDPIGGEISVPAVVREPDGQRPAFVVDSASALVEFGHEAAAVELVSAIRSTVRERSGIAFLSFARDARSWLPGESHLTALCDGHARFEPGAGGASAAVRFAHVRGTHGPVEGFPAVFNLDVGRRVAVDTVERN